MMREKSNAPNWLSTPAGQPRGYIESQSLVELWFHTGTNCNLSCPFCFEGSKPRDNRIEFITLEDIKPFIAEAVELGVAKFSFTGGEPFVNPPINGITRDRQSGGNQRVDDGAIRFSPTVHDRSQ